MEEHPGVMRKSTASRDAGGWPHLLGAAAMAGRRCDLYQQDRSFFSIAVKRASHYTSALVSATHCCANERRAQMPDVSEESHRRRWGSDFLLLIISRVAPATFATASADRFRHAGRLVLEVAAAAGGGVPRPRR